MGCNIRVVQAVEAAFATEHAGDRDGRLRRDIASRETTPSVVLDAMARRKGEGRDVLYRIVENPSTMTSTLVHLIRECSDNSWKLCIAQKAMLRLLGGEGIPEEVFDMVAGLPDRRSNYILKNIALCDPRMPYSAMGIMRYDHNKRIAEGARMRMLEFFRN